MGEVKPLIDGREMQQIYLFFPTSPSLNNKYMKIHPVVLLYALITILVTLLLNTLQI